MTAEAAALDRNQRRRWRRIMRRNIRETLRASGRRCDACAVDLVIAALEGRPLPPEIELGIRQVLENTLRDGDPAVAEAILNGMPAASPSQH